MSHTVSKSTISPKVSAVSGSRHVPLDGAKAIGPSNPHATFEVTLKLRRKEALPALHGRPKTLMTRDQLAANYGATDADIAKVSDVFKKLGLQVGDTNAATRSVRLSGTTAEMEHAFGVKLINYSHPSGNYRGRVGEVFVPAEVRDIVVGVFGLDNRRVARRRRITEHGTLKRSTKTKIPASWYTPANLAKRYNFPPGDGTGQAVGILEFGGGYFPADLEHFFSLANINAKPNVVPISTDGTSTSAKDGAEGEVMLDIEVIAGVCPKATIAVYFAQWTEQGWINALDAAIQDKENNPTVLSASWGAPEDTDIWTAAAMQQIDQTLQEAAHLGITVCIAAGDDGSSDADGDGHAHVDFPAASQYVLSVGGTMIPKKGAPLPDLGWFEGDGLRPQKQGDPDGGSTGGGVSAITPRPAWQSEISIRSVNPGGIVGRVMPDLAANADWIASPYLLVVDGQAQGNGGTSAASPLVASLIVLMNAARSDAKPPAGPVGYLTPVLYQPPTKGSQGATVGSIGCTDVISGHNSTAATGGYTAGPGYDADSGWGTPNGVQLLQALQGV